MSVPRRPFSLAQILPTGVVLLPRAPWRTPSWLPRDPQVLDALTGGPLALAGSLPVVCSEGAATPEGLELIEAAGLSPPTNLHTYRDEREYAHRLDDLRRRGHRFLVQHHHGAHELPPDHVAVPPSTLSRLNDKARLGAVVGDEHCVPGRVTIARHEARDATVQPPSFVKAAGPWSSGGGCGVVLWRGPLGLETVIDELGASRAVVESCLPLAEVRCVNGLVLPDGGTQLLGSAVQVTAEGSRYAGSIVELGRPEPELHRVLVERAGAVAARAGYRGPFGLDVATVADGRSVVLDANFRFNGSTTPLLAAQHALRPAGVLQFTSWVLDEDRTTVIRRARHLVDRGELVVLSLFDPAATDRVGPIRLAGLVPATTRADLPHAVDAVTQHLRDDHAVATA